MRDSIVRTPDYHRNCNEMELGKKTDIHSKNGEQGWRSGESARLPPMCPGFDTRTRRHMWAEFVV